MHLRLLTFKFLTISLLFYSLFPTDVVSQNYSLSNSPNYSKKTYQLHYADDIANVDGILDEKIWQQATQIELKYQNEPIFNTLAPVKTIAYLYHNDSHLFIGIKAFDPKPHNIRANLREHDKIFKDDNVGVVIDTYNDKRSGFGFFVNPLGAKADLTVNESDDSDEIKDFSWNAIWHSSGKIIEDGYVVEMSIPFHVLRFPDTEDELTWNIAIERNYPRETLVEMANYQQDRNLKCIICQYESLVGLKNINNTHNFQLTPTLTFARTDIKILPDELMSKLNNERWQKGDLEKDIGLDVRWGINKNLLLNATVNPDFSQVEADDVQLAINTTDALFYDERRPFFVDSADRFTTSLFDFVHTRNIVDPSYGVKMTGKTDQHSYGIMFTDDKQTNILIPSNQGSTITQIDAENTSTLARYTLDFGKLNNLGVLITNREADGYHNRLLSVDGSYWLDSQTSLDFQLASSNTKNPLQLQDDFDLPATQIGEAYSIYLDHQSEDFALYGQVDRVENNFRADLGFQSKVNFQEINLGGNIDWFNDELLWLSKVSMNQFSAELNFEKSWDLNNYLLEEGASISATLEGEKQSTITLSAIYLNSVYEENYYQENQVTLWVELTPIPDITLSSFIRYGDQIDFSNEQLGTRFKIAGHANWQINENLELEAEYDYSHLNVDGGQLYRADVIDSKFIWQLNSRQQFRFILQYTKVVQNPELYLFEDDINEQDKYITTQFLYSYTINPQTLFYFGYGDNGFEENNQQFIRSDRTVFAKFSYAFE